MGRGGEGSGGKGREMGKGREEGKKGTGREGRGRGKGRAGGAFPQIKIYDYTPV